MEKMKIRGAIALLSLVGALILAHTALSHAGWTGIASSAGDMLTIVTSPSSSENYRVEVDSFATGGGTRRGDDYRVRDVVGHSLAIGIDGGEIGINLFFQFNRSFTYQSNCG